MTIKLITLKEIRRVRDKMKSIDPNWVTTVAKLMNDIDGKTDETRVYNIIGGAIKSQEILRNFITCSKKHLEEMVKKQNEVLDSLKAFK